MKSLITPGICLVAVAALLHTGLVTPSPLLIAYAFYGVLTAGLLLAWRFHSRRIFLALLVLFLAEQAIGYFSSPVTSGPVAALGPCRLPLAPAALLLPLHLLLVPFSQEK